MPEVTCPRCQTRQDVGDADGYTCVSCGTAWAFATCENCAVRFHMRPGTTAWTCPECGHENGTAAMVDLGGTDDPEPAPPAVPDQAAAVAAPEPMRPTAAAPRHAAASPAPKPHPSGPPTRARLTAIAVMGIAWGVLMPGIRMWVPIWGRLVRDAGSELLPFSQVGGYVLGARAITLAGVPVDPIPYLAGAPVEPFPLPAGWPGMPPDDVLGLS